MCLFSSINVEVSCCLPVISVPSQSAFIRFITRKHFNPHFTKGSKICNTFSIFIGVSVPVLCQLHLFSTISFLECLNGRPAPPASLFLPCFLEETLNLCLAPTVILSTQTSASLLYSSCPATGGELPH